jgi:hypothetical protein
MIQLFQEEGRRVFHRLLARGRTLSARTTGIPPSAEGENPYPLLMASRILSGVIGNWISLAPIAS